MALVLPLRENTVDFVAMKNMQTEMEKEKIVPLTIETYLIAEQQGVKVYERK